jgi:hypothetical protein
MRRVPPGAAVLDPSLSRVQKTEERFKVATHGMAIRRSLSWRESGGKTAVTKLASRPGMRAGVSEDPRGMSQRTARSAPAMSCDLTGVASGRRRRTRPAGRRRDQLR